MFPDFVQRLLNVREDRSASARPYFSLDDVEVITNIFVMLPFIHLEANRLVGAMGLILQNQLTMAT